MWQCNSVRAVYSAVLPSSQMVSLLSDCVTECDNFEDEYLAGGVTRTASSP